MAKRKIIVHIGTSADGFIARPDGDMDWLTDRPAPKGFYGINKFMKSIDTKLMGRKTYDASLKLGATFSSKTMSYVFSRQPAVPPVPEGVEFVSEAIGPFAERLRAAEGKDIWMIGGGDLIASFLDNGAIDEFIVSVIPVFIGVGIPLIAPRHRHVPLDLKSVESFPDGVVQVHWSVQSKAQSPKPKGQRPKPRA
jgi:dihydrofolate reductase